MPVKDRREPGIPAHEPSRRMWARSVAVRLAAALVVVFLLFGPHFSMLLRDETRRRYLWQTSDAAMVLGLMLLIALACVAVGELVRLVNRPLLTRLFNHLFVVALGAGLLANLWYHTKRPVGYRIAQYGWEIRTLWLLLLGMVGYSLARPGSKLVLRARQLCLMFSPAVVILAVQLLSQENWSQGMDPIPTAPSMEARLVSDSAGAAGPIYLFIFDEWSYQRTFDNGAPRPEFANLTALAERSMAFSNARSPANGTTKSIPRLLFQTDLPTVLGDCRFGFERDGRFVPGRELESIFSLAGNGRYRTFMIGLGLPHRLLLGDQVDVCRSYCWLTMHRKDAWWAHSLVHAFNATEYWTDPWSDFVGDKIGKRVHDAQALWVYQDLERDMMEVIEGQPANTFAVLHYPLPHRPFLLDVDGSYLGVHRGRWGGGDAAKDIEGYTRNLALLDRTIGRIITAMKRAGRFDDALLIITSDHDWRDDPEDDTVMTEETHRHVPLLVKLPGQERSVTIDSLYETRHLGSLIAWTLNSDHGTEGLDQLLALGLADVGR